MGESLTSGYGLSAGSRSIRDARFQQEHPTASISHVADSLSRPAEVVENAVVEYNVKTFLDIVRWIVEVQLPNIEIGVPFPKNFEIFRTNFGRGNAAFPVNKKARELSSSCADLEHALAANRKAEAFQMFQPELNIPLIVAGLKIGLCRRGHVENSLDKPLNRDL